MVTFPLIYGNPVEMNMQSILKLNSRYYFLIIWLPQDQAILS